MPSYRKRPVIVEAEQFTESHIPFLCFGPYVRFRDGKYYVITAHNQKVWLKFGDWVVPESGRGTETDGPEWRSYPIKPDIFTATYEPVEEE